MIVEQTSALVGDALPTGLLDSFLDSAGFADDNDELERLLAVALDRIEVYCGRVWSPRQRSVVTQYSLPRETVVEAAPGWRPSPGTAVLHQFTPSTLWTTQVSRELDARGRVRLEAGDWRFTATIGSSTGTLPSEVQEAAFRIAAYLDQFRVDGAAMPDSGAAPQSIAGAIVKTGSGELLKAHRVHRGSVI